MKRIASAVLALILILSLVPAAIPAAADELYEMRDLKAGEAYTDMVSSQKLIDVIKDFEGFSATPYKDNSQWSVGYGSYCGKSSDPKPNIRLTEDEAEERLRKDLKKTYESEVNQYLKSIGKQPEQHQFDALVDLTYNVGGSWMRGEAVTSVVKNSVTALELVKGFGAYSRSGGKVSYVHVNRRIRESLMYLHGEYYRAYGNQDCKSDINVVSNDKLPRYKVVIFKSGSGAFSSGRTDYADYYAEGAYYRSFAAPVREGYTLVGWEITKRSNKSVENGGRISAYDIAEENLELTAVWEKGVFEVPPEEPPIVNDPPAEPTDPSEPAEPDGLPFTDVPEDTWFRGAVEYVYENG
jgi:GH24 family phage-related lysozyme (muramidase)